MKDFLLVVRIVSYHLFGGHVAPCRVAAERYPTALRTINRKTKQMRRVLIYLFLMVGVSCDSQNEQYLFKLQLNGHHWVGESQLSRQVFFDGNTTWEFPIVFAEKNMSADSIESFFLMIIYYNTSSFPDTIPLGALLPATLIHNIRHKSEPISVGGIRSQSGTLILNKLGTDNNNMFDHLKGTFNALLADSSMVTSGSFEVKKE
ncbi:hypothetical protein HUU42_08195 [bacterium]|nr:hypothetical protein [bacterium]